MPDFFERYDAMLDRVGASLSRFFVKIITFADRILGMFGLGPIMQDSENMYDDANRGIPQERAGWTWWRW